MTTQPLVSLDLPAFLVPEQALIPVNDYPAHLVEMPPSRMFLIRKMLDTYKSKFGADAPTFDASQGDGGASLPGVPGALLDRAHEMIKKQGTGYNMPYGTDLYRKVVADQYWKIDPTTGFGPQNIVATDGGRDGLLKAYQAAIALGTGRIGDLLLVSRVPWVSYPWGPYGVGMNVLLAPGHEESAWAYTEDSIAASVDFAAQHGGRRIAMLMITSPDNPTGNTLPMERQIALAHKAIDVGIPYVLFDWIYNRVTTGASADINAMLKAFAPEDRQKLIFLDGITKSLGGSNVRNAHLVASDAICKFVISRASHGVLPNYYGQAVMVAACEQGFDAAAAPIIGPTNESREVLRKFLTEKGYRFIMGEGGYYAFIDCTPAIRRLNLGDSEGFLNHIASDFGVAVVPGIFFSDAGKNWIRFSYALPPEKTAKAIARFDEGFQAK